VLVTSTVEVLSDGVVVLSDDVADAVYSLAGVVVVAADDVVETASLIRVEVEFN